MALARVSSFVIVAIAVGLGHVQAAESDFGVDISGPDVVAHAGVSAEEARIHAEELIYQGERLLQSIDGYVAPESIDEYVGPESIDEYDAPEFRSLRGNKNYPSPPMYPGRYPGNNPMIQPPMYPGGTSIANAENVWGDAIADSEAARGGTSVANSRTFSGTSIARSRSNRRLMMGPSKGMYYPRGGGGGGQYPMGNMGGGNYGRGYPGQNYGNYYPGGTSIANAQNTWGDSIADSEAARGGTSIANARTYSGTAIARSRSWRRLHSED